MHICSSIAVLYGWSVSFSIGRKRRYVSVKKCLASDGIVPSNMIY